VVLFRFITQVPGFVAVGLWFVFQVVSSLQVLGGSGDGVAYGAHIGGFIAGAALVKILTIGLPHNKPLTETYDDETYGRPRRTPWG
jgi:membrane associated rhomboid family serine protease